MKYLVDVRGELPKTGALANAKRFNLHELFDELAGDICDNYCKWPELYNGMDEDGELLCKEHCNNCPLVELI